MTRRVLVVDDSPTIRKVVTSILEGNGYEALTAPDGREALRSLHVDAVDLVLTDFVMPKMNGYQLCKELSEDARLKSIPVVLMSAKGEKVGGQLVQETGAVDAISKPFDPLGLLAVVERAFSRDEDLPSRVTDPAAAPDAWTQSAALNLDEIELSSDPGLRRTQVARYLGVAIAHYALPELMRISGVPPGAAAALGNAIRDAMTPERLSGLSGLLRTLDHGSDAQQVLSGDLAFVSIPEVLQMLELQRQSGALTISSPKAEITLFIREGLIDFARGAGLSAAFRLGTYLVQQDALPRQQLTHFLQNRAGSKRLIGDALAQLSLVTEAQVQQALVQQANELVYEVIRWKAGHFAFVKDATCPEADLAHLGLQASGIVMEGFRRVDEWRLIEGTFDFDEVLHRDQLAVERLGEKLTPTERAVLDAIDGTRSVRQIVDVVEANTFDVCKILYQFLNSRIVRREAA